MEQDSSQEGLDVSSINDTKQVTYFEGESKYEQGLKRTQGML
jgi:hypothetical protein